VLLFLSPINCSICGIDYVKGSNIVRSFRMGKFYKTTTSAANNNFTTSYIMMIKGGMFGVKWLMVGGMAFFLMLLIGCQEEGLPDEEGAEVSLSRVPNNPGFASLPLIGTPWKLLGFVDKRTNK